MNSLKVYNSVKRSLKSGDLILWKGNSLISRLIRKFTVYSHASYVMKLTEFNDLKRRRFVLEALAVGVVPRLLSHRLENYNGSAFLYPLKDVSSYTRKKTVTWGLTQIGTGKKYDFHSLFRNIFGLVLPETSRFFCSEFVYFAYLYAGIVEKEEKAPRPGDLLKWKELYGKPIQLI